MPNQIIRINENDYTLDGQIIHGTDELRHVMINQLGINVSIEQVRFIVRKRYVPEFILRSCPDFEYEDQYSGEPTHYAEIREVTPTKRNETTCLIEVSRIHTAGGKLGTTECNYKDHKHISITKLAELLQEDGINLTMGQLRHMIYCGKTESMAYKYPNLEIKMSNIHLSKDRRESESIESDSSNDKEVFIERVGESDYRYDGRLVNNIQVRELLLADGFLINKNTLSMMFGQNKIPKSVAERYPNLNYKDCR